MSIERDMSRFPRSSGAQCESSSAVRRRNGVQEFLSPRRTLSLNRPDRINRVDRERDSKSYSLSMSFYRTLKLWRATSGIGIPSYRALLVGAISESRQPNSWVSQGSTQPTNWSKKRRS